MEYNIRISYKKHIILIIIYFEFQAPSQSVIHYPALMYSDGLEQSTLGLHFRANHAHFPQGVMSLRCTAAIGVLYQQQEQAHLQKTSPNLSLMSREHLYGKFLLILVLLLALCIASQKICDKHFESSKVNHVYAVKNIF